MCELGCSFDGVIFTSPTFIKEKAKREKREFYIPRQEREKNLFGSEFEIKLRNEMTQKMIAKECDEWIRKKAVFKSNTTNEDMMGFINVDDKNYMPLNGFTTIDLGCERGNNAYYMVQKSEAPMSEAYLQLFEQIWNDESKFQEVTKEVLDNITTVYNENSPEFIYFKNNIASVDEALNEIPLEMKSKLSVLFGAMINQIKEQGKQRSTGCNRH